MADELDLPEPDRVEGAPHPRATLALFGQEAAEQAFLAAQSGGRMHHAWMITGPRGIGKATLAWRIARFVLAEGGAGGLFGAPESLDIPPDHPVARRMLALSEPGLHLARRGHDEKTKKLKTVISVDDIRALKSFFNLSATEGGWRVAIVDAADELNSQAANALLKILEEPPARALIILVCHQPARLLPTIRSRCRALRCQPLSDADLGRALMAAGLDAGDDLPALAALCEGAVGEAARLMANGGVALYRGIISMLAGAPGLDRAGISKLGMACSGAANAQIYDNTIRLTLLALSRLARAGAGVPLNVVDAVEGRMLARLSPDQNAARGWAELSQTQTARLAHARAVNLDPAQMILDTFLQIDTEARRCAS
ncbi:MAG: DNA polymerase III subunit delta' [Paracoccaceae bacterium]